ncbi:MULTISPECIES: type III-B CRISPR module RAMP protein Cmr1 [Aphanizomenon]|uniref:Type III-B CRISPR module RAMP protein Cmr1 n=1 Tax=Aphanizomenon flos-aquae FACHB-1249 TaxID=2692889 RepID=A0ABR8IXH7_APHFL|nr:MULTISPECIES: type III-B CRISPR module RAMP protein Cmr1 [Aphanizomenon]MBD2392603.1 type III-B CRISPR module RAMP protein Cmr1 [Aphanizomenon flos-aquae FACHB-1171]MBD2558957.1 type III-B CRISPR module RAMP protein Cmr1 [Aphanizomenon flos-aquae FACHB-1290]MBD2633661.1 type III-B CRISPR module RAMP protein Cmr1 [Aphanizomenon sp. FACHB-1399]MBD2644590.1 type III-B CRISPR module RAMP protein Cmr1 [Aphanizomenon sp. FACHB-1401]MBD2659287.1 type III-B CRISPR module RAMP protein Cmr1 [Aphanizo
MKNQKSEADIWRDFVQTEVKSKSKLGKILESSQYGGYDKLKLTVYFPDENSRKTAQGQTEAIKKKLREQYGLLCNSINFNFGSTTSTIVRNTPDSRANSTSVLRAPKNHNPLQALYWVEPNLPENDASQRMSILRETVAAEQGCNQIYTKLYQRTLQLADGKENTVSVSFNWRMRVGGTRGFRELLLPVLHPIFGIPYIPASTLKGAARAWARKNDAPARVQELLGMLNGRNAKAAKIEFLDAFPTKHCLSIDVATPQWAWKDNKVMMYGPVPHPLLSLEQPQFLIGLRPTSRQNSDCQDDLKTVKSWLENALNSGIGSRVSSGYGKALGTIPIINTRKSYDFELWTQGMYGSNPQIPEFRPSAVRGILRYWFRAVALGLYDVPNCQKLEEEIFGNLGKQGKISLSTKVNPSDKKDPCFYAGKIYLEATEIKYLNLAEKLLFLAVQLGGVGRGSRRPLHLLNRRMRGCHWEIVGKDLPLDYDVEQWRKFFTELKQVFQAIKTPIGSYAVSPGRPRARQQDVLDKNAQIWLLKSPSQIHPEKVTNWQTDGNSSKVRGAGLELLYSDTRFKGKGKGQGNPNVGGELGTPSFVWIKSIFTGNLPYQVITIFGSDYPDRKEFAKELKKQGAILVSREISPNKSGISAPIKKK